MSATTAHSPYFAVRQEWLDRRKEAILEPDLPIVDPHHHLWARADNPYMFDHLLADANAGHDIRATVFIDCRSMYRAGGPAELRPLGETEFVNGVAAMSASGAYGSARLCAGIVGFADLTLGARAEIVLGAHVALGGGRFKGVRHISAWDPDETIRSASSHPPRGLLLDKTFREGFSRLGPLGLSFDAWLFHPQLDDLTDLARAFPGTAIVMDHVGGAAHVGAYTGKHDAVFADWKAAMARLAACPNVCVKLGGLGMKLFGFDFHERPLPPSSEDLAAAWRPYIETCIELFGTRRCMYESNFPVDKGSCSYPILWNAFKRISAGASVAEKTDLFSGTAARFYRLGEIA
jgi:predicted TIM-barrel fold metal-dependent hydrolase